MLIGAAKGQNLEVMDTGGEQYPTQQIPDQKDDCWQLSLVCARKVLGFIAITVLANFSYLVET